MSSYEMFSSIHKNDDFSRKLIKSIIVSSIGKLLTRPLDVNRTLCKSPEKLIEVLNIEREIVDIRVIGQDVIEVAHRKSEKFIGNQRDAFHNVILGMYSTQSLLQ